MNAETFNMLKMPFSRYGSFIGVTVKEKEGEVFIHCALRLFGEDKVFCMTFFLGERKVMPDISFHPECLIFTKDDNYAKLYIKGENGLVIDGNGFGLTFKLFTLPSKNGDVPEEYPLAYGQQIGMNHFKIISVNARYVMGVHLFEGSGQLDGPYKMNERGNSINQRYILKVSPVNNRIFFQVNIDSDELLPSEYKKPDVEQDLNEIKSDWSIFRKSMPSTLPEFHDSALRSWFNLWSSTVPARGNYKYPGVIMSKDFMSSIWSWDHCFNALALSLSNIKAALEQFFLPFELQAANGALPDYVNPELEVVWGVTKPPIHGWCFNKLMDAYDLDLDVLKKAYKHLSLWTQWWMQYNDVDGDGVPDYPMGCDSGWDNSTVFDLGYYVESPDLCAYLIIQMNTLSRISHKLGNSDDEGHWKVEAQKLYSLFNSHSWVNGCYVAKVSHSHEFDEYPTSLITLIPLILGELLDDDRKNKMISDLKKYYLTDYGLATEYYRGKYYKSDNYWRGSIWAPSTYIIVDGLWRAGEKELVF
jgi:putative isomerase